MRKDTKKSIFSDTYCLTIDSPPLLAFLRIALYILQIIVRVHCILQHVSFNVCTNLETVSSESYSN